MGIIFKNPTEMMDALKAGTELYCFDKELFASYRMFMGDLRTTCLTAGFIERVANEIRNTGRRFYDCIGSIWHGYLDENDENYIEENTSIQKWCQTYYRYEWTDTRSL